MAATTWDPSTKGSQITLSGGNLVASTTNATTQGVLATRTLTGPSYWEVTATALSTAMGIGVANHLNANTLPGTDANSVGFRANGAVVLNGVTLATIQTFAAGNVVQVAVNPFTRLIWFNVNNGNWNNNATNNPATGVGGIDISSLVLGPLLPMVGFTNAAAATSTATAVFSSGFAFTPPSGFVTPDTCQAVSFTGDKAIGGSYLAVAAARQDPVTVTTQRSSMPAAPGAFYGTNRFQPQWSPAAAAKSISGTVTELSVPVAKMVRLYNRATGDFIAQTVSSAVDGSYAFTDLNPAITYEVVAFDLPNFNALTFDNVAPA